MVVGGKTRTNAGTIAFATRCFRLPGMSSAVIKPAYTKGMLGSYWLVSTLAGKMCKDNWRRDAYDRRLPTRRQSGAAKMSAMRMHWVQAETTASAREND